MTNWAQIFTGLIFYASICWDTPSENTGLWQLPQVSSAFNWLISDDEFKCKTLTTRKKRMTIEIKSYQYKPQGKLNG